MLDYPYFKENYKLIAIDLSKQQELDADPRAIQQINFTANLDRPENTCSLLLKKQKELFLNFHKDLWKFYECSSTECNYFEYDFIECNFVKYKV